MGVNQTIPLRDERQGVLTVSDLCEVKGVTLTDTLRHLRRWRHRRWMDEALP